MPRKQCTQCTLVAECKLGLIVAGVALARWQEVVQDEEARAGHHLLTVECHHIIACVVVAVATQTAKFALQHAPW